MIPTLYQDTYADLLVVVDHCKDGRFIAYGKDLRGDLIDVAFFDSYMRAKEHILDIINNYDFCHA